MKIDARGKQCPLPVIETKDALKLAAPGEVIEVTVDNEIAAQNLRKLAEQKSLSYKSEKIGDREFLVKISASDSPISEATEEDAPNLCCLGQGTVIAISSETMGTGDDTLGKLLMKGFLFAISKQENPPASILLYNGGAKLSCEGSESLEDLKSLEARDVTIFTCGTCLNYYGLSEKLAVGSVSNMYDIVETLTKASLVVRP
ncbi:MAG: sulfurtransferase-like selenium metabolism protein YedF [Firmicutes bacterium HGW-Firmicutes-16]|nr:MAG: sulfurtransferase-like selenium metabolism protein YedF [Firmicutes bacterium HGW-Firmicutes-16]